MYIYRQANPTLSRKDSVKTSGRLYNGNAFSYGIQNIFLMHAGIPELSRKTVSKKKLTVSKIDGVYAGRRYKDIRKAV